ncbi:MAG: hypothetical protein GY742_00395 [Hyphomicrobiales bacterium]|nr:hypothetical protein [Hyphomicrobiales bacterium]
MKLDVFKLGYSQPIVIRLGQVRLPIESGHSGVYDRNEYLLENTFATGARFDPQSGIVLWWSRCCGSGG